MHVRGTKTATRDGHEILIEPWALPYLIQHCRGLMSNVRLWPETMTRHMAHHHRDPACKLVSLEDYSLRDARHSVAVRARKRGASLEWIAQQLGHKNIYQAATVYGRFLMVANERRRVVAK